jgi:hypothetical protein
MPRPRRYSRYLSSDDDQKGFSAIAPNFWQSAEKLRTEAVQVTARQNWKVHWTIPSAICLYHAALGCFINEEIVLAMALVDSTGREGLLLQDRGRLIQDKTLSADKLDNFFSFFRLAGKGTPEVRRRTLLFIALRDRLYHHMPEMRDRRDYPDQVIEALNDAGIEPVNTSWAAQCTDIRLAEWASKAVREFIDDWCRAGGISSRMQEPGWEFGVSQGTGKSRLMDAWKRWLARFSG